jgi:hypothetical protein
VQIGKSNQIRKTAQAMKRKCEMCKVLGFKRRRKE